MKKCLLTRGLAIGMVCTMAFSCACGKKKDNTETDKVVPAAKIDREHVYTMEDMILPVDGNYYVNGCCNNNDSFYALVSLTDSDDYSKKLFKMSYENQEVTEIPLEGMNGVDNFECDKDGNLYLYKNGYDFEAYAEDEDLEADAEGEEASLGDESESEEVSEDAGDEVSEDSKDETSEDSADSSDDSDGEILSEGESGDVITGYEEGNANATIVKLSSTGETLWEVPLTEEDTKGYMQSMRYVDGKGLLTNCNGEFSLYDENTGEGKSLFKRHEPDDEDYYYSTLYRMKNGDVYLSEDNWGSDGRPTILKLNKDTMQFDEEVKLPEDVYGGENLQPGNAYDFYVNDSSEIRAFNLGDEKAELVCDFTASDLLIDYVGYISDTPDGQIMISVNQDDGNACFAFLSKVDPNEVSEKETLTIGTVYVPNSVRQQVVKFNRKSDKYRISIVDYSENITEDTGDAYFDAANKIGLDLAQGQGPDMLVMDYGMPAESYAKKGALEPLDPYFDADPELNVTDYLENVVESTKVDGKIFTLVPSFNIETCVVAKDKVGDGKVTIDNYKDVCSKNGIDPQLVMGTMTKGAAAQLYSTVGTQFIDYENGTCSFDSQGFIDLLNFINDLPEDSEAEDVDYEETDSYYRENKALLMTYYINSFEDYQVLKKGYFGKDISFNGFPTSDDGVSFIQPYLQIAMNADCKHKDAAWEFMRSFMTDEFQKDIEWSFPTKNSAIDALAAKAQEKPYYIDSNGKKVEQESTWSVGGVDVKIEELSKEETTEFIDFVKSVTDSALYEEKIINIINEEAGAFYEGQKTAEEVADIIQSRVSIYMSENM